MRLSNFKTNQDITSFMENNNLTKGQKIDLAIKLHLIDDIEPELIEKLKNSFFAGYSAYIFLITKSNIDSQKSYDKNLALTLGMENFSLVRGNLRTSEDASTSEQVWVESEDSVYISTNLKKYKKWFFYYLENVTNTRVLTKEQILADKSYMHMRTHGLQDFISRYPLYSTSQKSTAYSQGDIRMLRELERLDELYENITKSSKTNKSSSSLEKT